MSSSGLPEYAGRGTTAGPGCPASWRRRWRRMDRQQRFRVGIVLRAALIVFLLWVAGRWRSSWQG